MSFFPAAIDKYLNWNSTHSHRSFTINGLSSALLPLFLADLFSRQNRSTFIVCPDLDQAEELFSGLKSMHFPSLNLPAILLFPGLSDSPYAPVFSSERDLFKRFAILDQLLRNPLAIVVTTVEAMSMALPPRDFFENNRLCLCPSDIVSPQELAEKLVSLGYNSATSVEEPGSFSRRGEIFDIYPLSHGPVRLHYFDDMIEEIFPIDLSTQKTKRELPLSTIWIGPTAGILVQETFRNQLRDQLARPAFDQKSLLEIRQTLFSQLSSGQLFENYPVFVPAFFASHHYLADYMPQSTVILVDTFRCFEQVSSLLDRLREDFGRVRTEQSHLSLLPDPMHFYDHHWIEKIEKRGYLALNDMAVEKLFEESTLDDQVALNIERAATFLSRHINPTQNKFEYFKSCLNYIKDHFNYQGSLYFACASEQSKKEIQFLVSEAGFERDLLERVHYISVKLPHGFYYPSEKMLILTDSDIFSRKQNKTKRPSSKDIDLFAEQLATLKIGDFVIHSDHGIGIYQGLETMTVGATQTDYLVIHYAENDKIYVPVYKMNQIQKHADKIADLKPASLRTNKFNQLKDRAKESAKKLAFDLLKLQAERQTAHAFSFSELNHLDKEFALAFPFDETPDQTRAIDEVLEAMAKPIPMDYLVCGDVGFGKTEVAMRAAFKAVNDGKQVAILVPTTILALQHFSSFQSRFKGFPITIEFVSRFKTAQQVKQIEEDLALGKIDILVGTHKILSSGIKFKDLGLVVVDEEQRFGVGHKEQLKLLKTSVDFLTLTATPIPRTLQLAFLGLRDLSLIQTAPPRRQSIKTYLIKEDDLTLKSALDRELARGGQVFYVHNRVQDIEQVHHYIQELVPEARIVVAHGQMAERELETKIKDFYAGKFQILLSTTIIESGIDIPNANTLIVDRADTYGLSQLHQLRGRIGRSDRKAYAYFVIPALKPLSTIAESRLKALQTYADMGSGFSIASADLEIRGAGDILGASQSGHIEAVGLELYMELLKEAILELRGEQKVMRRDIEINTPFPAFIPAGYITDSPQRLKYYKRLANCDRHEVLAQLKDEMLDIFGIYPESLNNLFLILESRIYLQGLGLKSIQVAGSLISLQFDRGILESNEGLRTRIVETFMKRPKVYQFTPDYKVLYTHKVLVDQGELLAFAKNVAQQLVPC